MTTTAHDIEQSAQSILSAVADRFGISLSEVGTGGGCMALEGRLESGHWIVATDDGLCSLRSRLVYESVARDNGDSFPQGWSVGIYRNDPSENTWMSYEDAVVDVVDYDAVGDALPEVIGRALAMFVSSQLATVTDR
jgi:hypothetical protein